MLPRSGTTSAALAATTPGPTGDGCGEGCPLRPGAAVPADEDRPTGADAAPCVRGTAGAVRTEGGSEVRTAGELADGAANGRAGGAPPDPSGWRSS